MARRAASGGGQSLGNAQGSINISTTGVTQAEVAVAQASARMTGSMTQMNAAASRTQNVFTELKGQATQLAGALGLSLGVAGVVQLGKFAIAASVLATTYERQSVAALGLAGSQEKLNDLLEAYARATGGVIGKAQALADVTRLQAVGFADSAAELEAFARVARGISVATGQSQDYVISQLQLAIANQSTLRLDQLGLGVSEVKERIDELKEANSGLSDELAYQQAILGIAEQKFGALVDSTAAQITEVERLSKAWADWRLELGRSEGALPQRLNQAAGWLAGQLENETEGMASRNRPPANTRPLTQAIEDKRGEIKALEQSLVELNAIEGVDVSPLILQTKQHIDDLTHAIGNLQRQVGAELARGPSLGAPPWMASVQMATGAGATAPRFDADQTALIREWSVGVRQIESQANAQRLSETQSFESQQASTINQYNTTRSREAEDHALNRARAEQAHADQIAEIRESAVEREVKAARDLARQIAQAQADMAERIADAQENAAKQAERAQRDLGRRIDEMRENSAKRVAEWEEDRDESIVEARQKSAERLVELEEEYNRNRERAAAEFADRQEDAASRLDANALYTAQRDYERSLRDAEEAHNEAVSEEGESLQESLDQINESYAERLQDEAEALQESIDQANLAHQRQQADANEALADRIADEREATAKRLEAARIADAQRLEDAAAADEQRLIDMQTAFDDQKRQEDEDRRIRLGRMQDDHTAQLGEMKRAHDLRITQIGTHAQEERAKLDDEFLLALDALEIRIDGWVDEQERLTDAAIDEFDKWWEHIQGKFAAPVQGPAPLNPMIAPPGQWPSLTTTVGNVGSNSNVITITPTIYIYETQDAGRTGEEVEKALIRIGRELSKPQ